MVLFLSNILKLAVGLVCTFIFWTSSAVNFCIVNKPASLDPVIICKPSKLLFSILIGTIQPTSKKLLTWLEYLEKANSGNKSIASKGVKFPKPSFMKKVVVVIYM